MILWCLVVAYDGRSFGFWQGMAKNLLTEDVYMCDKTHKHHEIHRIPRRCPTLVFTPGQRAVAVGDRFPIVAHRAMYSRELLGLPAWSGPCQLCLVRTPKKPTFLGLRSPGNASASSTGSGQRAEASEADRRTGTTLYRSPQGETRGGWEFREKEAREMITVRYQQRTIYEPLALNVMADYKELYWERWLLEVDGLLEDEELVKIVKQALEKRHRHSRTRGRLGTPVEVVLRLMALKQLRGWSIEVVEREVRANVVYREFTRIGGEKVPDAKRMVRWGKALGPEVTRAIHKRVVDLGRKRKVVSGRKLRVDTTVAET